MSREVIFIDQEYNYPTTQAKEVICYITTNKLKYHSVCPYDYTMGAFTNILKYNTLTSDLIDL